jgi:hypothetical protein
MRLLTKFSLLLLQLLEQNLEKTVVVDKEQMSKYLDLSEMESLENGYGVFGEATSIKSICIKDDTFCCN